MGSIAYESQANLAPPSYDHATAFSDQSNYPDDSIRKTRGTIKFPTRLVYNPSWVSTTSYLGRSKDEKLFAVQTPSRMVNCLGLGKIMLRDGTDKNAPAIASVSAEKGSFLRRSMIRVPAKPGAHEQGGPEVVMDGDWSRKHSFSLPLGNGVEEHFEWRRSRGDEVHELKGAYSSGWKLVRLDSPDGNGMDRTSDGKEVVAVAALPKIFQKNPEFALLGSGACGELGENFEIVAVMGFLRLYDLYMQQSIVNSNAAAASSASASVAAS